MSCIKEFTLRQLNTSSDLEVAITFYKQFMIQVKRHQIYTLKQNKVALNKDDKEEFKQYICNNKTNTY